jgi:ribosomal-protein-alanine N-acetyltransferase
MIVMETPRLVLRHFEETDLPTLHSMLSDPIVMKFWPAPFTLEQSQQWLERHFRNYRETGLGRYAVISKESQTLIGDCGIVQAELDGKPENDLGYIIARDAWGNGYATEAAEACLHYGLDHQNLRRVCANMPFNHVASRRVAEHIGMQREKEYINKRNRDILTFLYVYEKE